MNRQTLLNGTCLSVIALAVVWGGWPSSASAAEDEQAIREWVRKLGDESYRARREAHERLIAIGEPAVKALTEALKSEDPEVKARAETALEVITRRGHQARTEAIRKGFLWASPVDGGTAGAPVVSDGMAFVAGGKRNFRQVYAVDIKTGRKVWVSDQTGTFTRLRAGGGLVFAMECLRTRTLFAYDARKGTVVWSHKVPCSGAVQAALSGGVVYVGGSRLMALDAGTGKSKWEVPLNPAESAGPAVAGGAVYVACLDGKLRVLDAATGREKWAFQGTLAIEIAVADGVLCMLGESAVLAMDVKEKKELWRFSLPGGRVNFRAAVRINRRRIEPAHSGSLLCMADGTVYVSRGAGSPVYALSTRTGKKRWDYTHQPAAGHGVGAANGIFIGGRAVRIVAGARGVRIQGGRVILPGGLGSSTSASPAVSKGVVYCPAEDSLRAVDAATGRELWRLPTTGRPRTPTIADGVLLFGTQAGSNVSTIVQGGVVIIQGNQGRRPPTGKKDTKTAATRKTPGLFAVRLPPAKGQ